MANDITLIRDVSNLLKQLLQGNVDGLSSGSAITFDSPENIDSSSVKTGLSIFLYRVEENPYLKNRDILNKDPNNLQRSPLVLDLHYLLTPYSFTADSPRENEQMILAQVMQVLYDNAILSGSMLGTGLLDSGNTELRVVPNTMTLDQMYQLWSIIKAGDTVFRISVPYIVTPLQIQSGIQIPVKRVLQKEFDYTTFEGKG